MKEETCSNDVIESSSNHKYLYVLSSARTIRFCSKCNKSWELQGEVETNTNVESNFYGWISIPTIKREEKE